ncbi:MAG TPA: hypothetical protein VHI93_01435 [Candidatus Thermoplasmatota archaeon]|nr:hypothetical protein [Candidatus Thermoplasmatota archaeon]
MPFVIPLSVAVPANTPATAPVKATVRLPAGSVIDRLLLHVPAGCQALAPVWFEKGGGRIVPTPFKDTTPEIRLDDISGLELLAFPLGFRQEVDFSLVGYNEDTSYSHTTRAILIGRYASEIPAGTKRMLELM